MRLSVAAVLLVLAVAACGSPHPQAARILPAPAPNAVPFTGPLPTYSPAGAP